MVEFKIKRGVYDRTQSSLEIALTVVSSYYTVSIIIPSFPLSSPLGLVRLFSIHMDWTGLIRIERDFNLLGIETPLIPINPYGLG
jgi:hypothetical protein